MRRPAANGAVEFQDFCCGRRFAVSGVADFVKRKDTPYYVDGPVGAATSWRCPGTKRDVAELNVDSLLLTGTSSGGRRSLACSVWLARGRVQLPFELVDKLSPPALYRVIGDFEFCGNLSQARSLGE